MSKKKTVNASWRDMTSSKNGTYLLRIIDGRFHYEILKTGPRVWDLYFGDDENRSVGQDNQKIATFPDMAAAKSNAKNHAKQQAVAS